MKFFDIIRNELRRIKNDLESIGTSEVSFVDLLIKYKCSRSMAYDVLSFLKEFLAKKGLIVRPLPKKIIIVNPAKIKNESV